MAPDIYAPLGYRPTLIPYRTAIIDTYFVHNTCVFRPDFADFYLFIYLFICLFIYLFIYLFILLRFMPYLYEYAMLSLDAKTTCRRNNANLCVFLAFSNRLKTVTERLCLRLLYLH